MAKNENVHIQKPLALANYKHYNLLLFTLMYNQTS